MWSAHSYYMVKVMLVRYVNINARCRASGVLVPLACVVGGNWTTIELWAAASQCLVLKPDRFGDLARIHKE